MCTVGCSSIRWSTRSGGLKPARPKQMAELSSLKCFSAPARRKRTPARTMALAFVRKGDLLGIKMIFCHRPFQCRLCSPRIGTKVHEAGACCSAKKITRCPAYWER
jgi:hypothetical protein